METSQLHAATAPLIRPAKKQNPIAGFSILELLIAITVLVVGLTGMAALFAQTLGGTEKARYMALATTLASEKIEDLNRFRSVDPRVAAGGSLSSDGSVATINYYDDVDLSNTSGQVSETTAITSGYSSVIHKSTGEVISNSNSSAPSGSGNMAFHRRWLVEADPTVGSVTLTGSRRVTVLVTMAKQGNGPPISFQMSLVRP